jgi:hypothetical protein
MNANNYPKIIFPEGFNEQNLFELPSKGWVNIKVLLSDNISYSIFFIDPIRLQQDLDDILRSGEPCFAEPGLVILPEVTDDTIRASIQFLWRTNFFTNLKPE